MSKKRLSKKEKGFIKDFAKTGNATEAAANNYDVKNRGSAKSIGAENLTKPHILSEIKSIADSIPDSLLIEKHLALLNREEIVVKNNNKSGEIEVIPTGHIDVQAVKAGLDMSYKLKNKYAPEQIDLKFRGFSREQLITKLLEDVE